MCIRTEMHTRGLIDLVYLQSISSSSRQASLTIGSVHATRGALKLRRAPGTNGPTVRESKPPSRFATTTPAAMSVSTDEENPSVVHQAKLVSVEVSTPGNHAAVLAELALYREEAERLRRVTPARTSCCPGAWTSLAAAPPRACLAAAAHGQRLVEVALAVPSSLRRGEAGHRPPHIAIKDLTAALVRRRVNPGNPVNPDSPGKPHVEAMRLQRLVWDSDDKAASVGGAMELSVPM